MPQKRHTVDQIVAKLRKADVELGKGKKVSEVCKLLKMTTRKTCERQLHQNHILWAHQQGGRIRR